MMAWDFSFTMRAFVLDVSILGALLIAGTLLRRYMSFFQRFLIPNCLIAGFLGLCLGPEALNWLSFSVERMGYYVYHLLVIMFIAVGLRDSATRTKAAIHFSFIQIMVFLCQTLVGLALAFGIMYWIQPPP